MTSSNADVDRNYVERVLNGGDLAAIDEIMAPNYVGHVPGFPDADREGDKQLIAMLRGAFPDLRFLIEDQIAAGDRVVHRLRAEGTHLGEFQGVAATGKKVVVTGVNINRFEKGRVAEAWGFIDTLGLLQQIGPIPGAGPRP